jgi:protein-tyrosine-phosphatase
MRAVFICSGNICRSPMAERIFAEELKVRGDHGAAISMSTLGLHGRTASKNARTAASESGLDLEAHRSQPVSAGLLVHADVIFVMEAAHREFVLRAAPSVGPRIVLMGTLDPEGGPDEIDDPVGQSIEVFRRCRDRLRRSILAWFDARG